MDYIIIIFSILILALVITLVKYSELYESKKRLEDELAKTNAVCHDVLYDNCVLTDKIEKIKNLNLIDCTNNDYYKELLTVNK